MLGLYDDQTQTVFLELTSPVACQAFSLIIMVRDNNCSKCHGNTMEVHFGHKHFLSNFSLTGRHYAEWQEEDAAKFNHIWSLPSGTHNLVGKNILFRRR